MDEVARTVADAMLTTPVRHRLDATVREIRDFFEDDHVHAALVVGPAGYLAAVVERNDIVRSQAPDAAAAPLGRLAGPRRARRRQPECYTARDGCDWAAAGRGH